MRRSSSASASRRRPLLERPPPGSVNLRQQTLTEPFPGVCPSRVAERQVALQCDGAGDHGDRLAADPDSLPRGDLDPPVPPAMAALPGLVGGRDVTRATGADQMDGDCGVATATDRVFGEDTAAVKE